MARQEGPILVIGATGQQGGAVVRELLKRGRKVRALTRTPSSAAAKQLADQGATLVQGDLEDPASIHQAMSGTRAVFAVSLMTQAGVAGEVRQGKGMAEAAKNAEIAHLIYSSVDGAERESGIPHFESKWLIEQHLQALGVPTTVLRPTAFMENFAVGARPTAVDGTLLVRLGLRPDTELQMVACADIGALAADVFERPGDYIGQAVALAGDQLTGPQMAEVFQEISGMPARFEEQPLDQIRVFSEDMALMFQWINDAGYDRADIAALREQHPELRTLKRWLRETSWQVAAG